MTKPTAPKITAPIAPKQEQFSQSPLAAGQLLDQFQTAQEYQTRDRVLNDYIKYTGEAPGAEQYASAAQAIAGGKTLNDVSRGISSSPKANAKLVETAYTDILGRPPEPEAVNYWTNQLNKGTLDKATFLDGLAKSSEGVNWANTTAVNDMYKEFYGRDPDKTDINKYGPYNDYLSKLAEGTLTMDQVRQAISQDPEAKSYEDSQLVKNMFSDLTGRTPPQYIMDDYTSKFAAGTMDFDKLFDTINATPEAQEYTRLLKEGVSPKTAGEQAEIKTNRDIFSKALDAEGITDPALRNIMASQVEAETRFLNVPESSYKTTGNARLKDKFSALKGMSNAELNELKQDDRAFFNKIYGKLNGNKGGEDGYNFRGRGAIQLTGRENYLKYSQAAGLGDALVRNPDLMFDPNVAAKVSIKFMEDKLKHHPGATPFDKITRGVNSSSEAVAKKRAAYGKFSRKKEFSIPGAIEPPGQPGPVTPDPDATPLPPKPPSPQTSLENYNKAFDQYKTDTTNYWNQVQALAFITNTPQSVYLELGKANAPKPPDPANFGFSFNPETKSWSYAFQQPAGNIGQQLAQQGAGGNVGGNTGQGANGGVQPIVGTPDPGKPSWTVIQGTNIPQIYTGGFDQSTASLANIANQALQQQNAAAYNSVMANVQAQINSMMAGTKAVNNHIIDLYQMMGSAPSGGGTMGISFPKGTGAVYTMNKGGAVWDKSRPKSLGKPDPLSKKQKSSAKAAAKAAGRPYPNLVDNMRAAQKSHGGPLSKAMNLTRRILDE